MPLQYRDAVVLLQKSPGGKLSRVNAIVLSSSLHSPLGRDRKVLKDKQGKDLPPVEHLDLAFPREFDSSLLKTRNMDTIFQPAYAVAPWKEGASIGWQRGSTTAVPPAVAPKPAPAIERGKPEPVKVEPPK